MSTSNTVITRAMKVAFSDKIKMAFQHSFARSLFLSLSDYEAVQGLCRFVDDSKNGMRMIRQKQHFHEVVGDAVKDDDEMKEKWEELKKNLKYKGKLDTDQKLREKIYRANGWMR